MLVAACMLILVYHAFFGCWQVTLSFFDVFGLSPSISMWVVVVSSVLKSDFSSILLPFFQEQLHPDKDLHMVFPWVWVIIFPGFCRISEPLGKTPITWVSTRKQVLDTWIPKQVWNGVLRRPYSFRLISTHGKTIPCWEFCTGRSNFCERNGSRSLVGYMHLRVLVGKTANSM